MRAEEIVAFLQRRGHRVNRSDSCWWYDEYHQSRVYYSFPPHRLVDPAPQEIATLFRGIPGALAVRFLAPLDSRGRESFLWVCRSPYDLSSLGGKSRNQTRRGLERCEVQPITWKHLAYLAWEPHWDTSQRHGVGRREAGSLGIDGSLQECPAYEAWGAFVDGHLAAYVATLWVESWVHILVHRSANAYLKTYANNALTFSVVQQLLSRPGVSAVSYGWEPLHPLKSLDHFKQGMGFVQEPVRQRVHLVPWLKPFLNPFTCRAIERSAAFHSTDRRLQRLAGFCRILRES